MAKRFSSALCYCTAELLLWLGRPSSSVVRPSSVHRHISSDTTEWINAKFGGQVPIHHISRPLFYFILFCFIIFFFKILDFWFHGPHGSKNFKRLLLWKYTSDSIPPNHAYKVVQRNVKFQIWNFWIFFFFVSVNMGPYWSKIWKQHLPWKNTPDLRH